MKKYFKTKKIIFAISIIIATFMFNSCATLLSGDSQKIFVDTEPKGAKVYVNGKDQKVITPATIDVRRRKQVEYTFLKEGYKDGTVIQNGSFNFVTFGNIILGGIIGLSIDFATGATWQYKNPNVFYQFKEITDSFDEEKLPPLTTSTGKKNEP